jgi:hypothetical protein
MQRRAAAAYVTLLVVIAAGAFAMSATASPPDISVDADHELQENQSITRGGTSYTVASLNESAPSASLEWSEGNESTTLEEGTNVTLGGTNYTSHFEGDRLQLTSDQEAYMNEVRAVEQHHELMHGLKVVATLSGLAGFLLLAMAYMPVRGD